MNERGREVLRAAALRGVRQIRGRAGDDQGGYCALGVLVGDFLRGFKDHRTNDFTTFYGLSRAYVECPTCGKSLREEKELVMHLNDTEGLDFLAIANKAPDEVAP